MKEKCGGAYCTEAEITTRASGKASPVRTAPGDSKQPSRALPLD